jgi:hypothetical protein
MKFSSQIGPRGFQPPIMTQMNQLSRLALIMEHGPIPRTCLARLSRLTKPTVSAFKTPVLVDNGLNLAAVAEMN